MRYSQLPFKTSKTVSSELASKNAKLLTKTGYIHQEIAGVYTFLPLGLRVLNKIENIIREEMDKIGVEVLMSSLAPIENWEKTGRGKTNDVLMKITPANAFAKAKNDTEYILGPTHEEIVTPLVQKYAKSYKDFPFAVYQIQTKFRNEPRAKSGLLRCREFRMKDLYSFHTSEEDLKAYYERVKESYWNVFERLGLGRHTSFLTLASGGDFTTDYSHEFQTICDAGEDTLFHVKSKNLTFNREIAPSMSPPVKEMSNEEMKPLQEIEGKGIIGVEELAKYVNIPVEKTTKTLLFENEDGEIIAAAVRGGYDINIEKLQKITGSNRLVFASAEKVKKVTGAEVGYAGLLHLPKEVRVYMDESMKDRRNFEMGANKTNYHSININFSRDLPQPEQFYDFKIAKEGDLYPETEEKYEVYRAAEIGNIFPLYTKFTKAFGFHYVDEKGQRQPIYMGCYGIGPSRIMGVLVEKFADEKGLVWPRNVAPFHVHLVGIHSKNEELKRIANKAYEILLSEKIDVFYDDRDVSAGEKFIDADLLGIPYRIAIGANTNLDSYVEFKERTNDQLKFHSLSKIIKIIKESAEIR